MLNIQKVDHLGIRVSDKTQSISFYNSLGYELMSDAGFEQGHPVIMQHPSGVVINLLGPATDLVGKNVLMDMDEKYTGYTHVALHIESVEETEKLVNRLNIAITGRHQFKGINTIFIRDPDRNVIELVEHTGSEFFSSVPSEQHA